MRERFRACAILRLLGAAAALALPPASARAQPGAPAPPADPIPVYDVYVTSQQDVVSAVTTTREITREDMHQEGARTLDEAVVHEPSVIVRTGGEGSPRIDIRGLRTRQILTLIDGIPFYSTDDGAFDPSLIPTQIMERVDITYSNSSVLYGDGPIAGIVQIRTRGGEAGLHPEAKGDFRSGAQYLGEGSLAGAGRGVEGFAAGRYYHSKGWELPDSFDATPLENGGRRDNSDRKQANAFAKLGYMVNESARVDGLFDYWHSEYGVPWRVEQQTALVGRARFERVDEVDGFTSQLSGQLGVGDRVDLRSWGFLSRQVEQRSSYDDPDLDSMLTRDTFRLDGTTLISGGALHGSIDGGGFGTLRLAANGRYEHFESQGRIRNVPMGGGNFGWGSVDERDGLGAYSLAAEHELKPREDLGLVLGYGHAFLDADHGVDDDGSLFLAGAYLDLPTSTRLRGSAAHKLRFPSLRQLYAVDGGNPSVESERCWCFEVGVTQQLPGNTRFGVTGFWLELKDFIERGDVSNLFENRQELESRGFEVELASRPLEPLLLRAAFTFLDAHDRSSGSPFDRLDNRPRYKVDAELRYRLPTQTAFRFAMTWLGGNLAYTRIAPIQSVDLDDFAIFDLRLEQPFWSDRVRLYFGIDNLTDQASELNVAFPQPGRSFYGGIDLRL
jgi:outer membrane cobalamin receptor